MHASSLENMHKCLDKYMPTGFGADQPATVVDIGAADVNGSYRVLFADMPVVYIGVDLEPGPGVDLVAEDTSKLPLADQSADIVLSGQALEHSEFFWLTFSEMVRVAKPDGLIFLVVPSEGPIHRYPVDCYRFYPDALTALARYTGCHLIEWWRDERGPWRDLVGVFARKAISRVQTAPPLKHPPRSLRMQTPSARPEEERVRGATPCLTFLGQVHAALRPRGYLEIGVRHGRSLSLAGCPSVAVDPWPELEAPAGPEVSLFAETSDWFFELHAKEALAGPVDLAFIDGAHRFENVLRDFMNVERYSHPATLVVIDDVFPNHAAQAHRERHTQVWTGDVWKIIPCLKRHRPDLLLVPIDTAPTGMLLVLGCKRGHRVLCERYNPIVREILALDSVPPVEILDRDGARPGLDSALEGLLRELSGLRADKGAQDRVRECLGTWRKGTR